MTKKLISYIFPIYNESGSIPMLYSTMSALLKSHPRYNYELIFINDGSRDNSLELLTDLSKKDVSISIIDFSRNFGHQIAVTAGLDFAQGDAVIIMDSDLQDPPKVSFDLINKWEDGFDVVYAQRRTRKDSFFKKVTANLFYLLLRSLADIEIPRNTGDFRLLDRSVVNEMKKFREHNRFLRGMVSFIGFNQTAVQFDRDARHAGETGYPLKKMIKFAADGILGFSSAPLTLISRLGYVIAGLSVIGILYAISVKYLFPAHAVEGWAFIVISIFFIGGVQMIMLGVLGSYIGRIYTESQNRPLYIVRNVISGKK